ncbi:MAG: hypothetical protein JWP81_4351 [Ferruginibacter sp.]|nr:hypothetical protein [Ferruginibacter sp.]
MLQLMSLMQNSAEHRPLIKHTRKAVDFCIFFRYKWTNRKNRKSIATRILPGTRKHDITPTKSNRCMAGTFKIYWKPLPKPIPGEKFVSHSLNLRGEFLTHV